VIPRRHVPTGWELHQPELGNAVAGRLLKRRREAAPRLMMPRFSGWNCGAEGSGEGGVADSVSMPLAF